MPLSAPDIATLSRLLDQALELDAIQREAWLSGLPASDQHWVSKLREMLAERDSTGTSGFLAALPAIDDPGTEDESTAQAGEAIGPYRLLREIGRGGMGTVWLAERADGAFKRQVALKLPRLAWGAGLVKRMAREREIGAMLEHPNIARLYDAGVDERGRPFIALEHIDGVAIDVWCRQSKLTVRQKLGLIVQVAKAVAYAHGRLVVHRDLKPSNVMVSADGQVRLLDFGIARLLDDTTTQDHPATQEQVRAFTPQYAAPEQLRGDTLTVQSDIYSLGVLAYELLTGQMPFDTKRRTPAAIEEAILQGEAIAPSQRVEDRVQARQLKGDIDAIVGKATKVEQNQRYATADALAADIERFLGGEAVGARPDSSGYRLRKLLRRHWIGVSASAAVLVSILAGAGVAVVQAQRAAKAAEKERAVRAFVTDVFRVNVKAPAPGELKSAPAEAFLEQSAKLVKARFDGQPAEQAELYAVLSKSFEDMGAYRLAATYASQRLAAMDSVGADRLDQAQAHLDLARILLNDRQFDAAESHALRGIELGGDRRQVEIGANLVLIETKQTRGQMDDADRLLKSVEDRIALNDQDALLAARAMQCRAYSLATRNRRPEAVRMYEAAVARALSAEGVGSAVAAEIQLELAFELASTEQDAKSHQHFRAGYEVIRAQGHEHAIRAAGLLARYVSYRYRAGDQTTFETALADIGNARTAIAATGRAVPAEVAMQLDWNEGAVLSHFGNIQAAAPLLNRSVPTLFRQASSPGRRFHLSAAYANQLQRAGQHAEADVWFRAKFKARVEMGEGAHPWAAGDYRGIADNLRMMGRLSEAVAFLETAPTFPQITLESRHPDRYNLHLKLLRSEILLDGGHPVRALAEFPRDLLEPLGRGEPSWSDAEARFVFGRLLCANQRAKEGVDALGVVVRHQQTKRYKHAPELAYRRAVAGLCALLAGDRQGAQSWAQQARESFTVQPGVSDFYKAPLLELEWKLAKR